MQGNNGWTDVRMFYTKTGNAKYISHLDTVRCITRALKRAAIPVWFTQGFNPHAFLTFAMPLSLGYESLCETVDFRLVEEMDFQLAADSLNKALPNGFEVKRISKPVFAASDIRYAQYEITFENYTEELCQKARSVISLDEITVEKKVKQGKKKAVRSVNIREHIKEYSVSEKNKALVIKTTLSAGTKNNINPSLLIEALVKGTGFEVTDADVKKIQTYTENSEIFR